MGKAGTCCESASRSCCPEGTSELWSNSTAGRLDAEPFGGTPPAIYVSLLRCLPASSGRALHVLRACFRSGRSCVLTTRVGLAVASNARASLGICGWRTKGALTVLKSPPSWRARRDLEGIFKSPISWGHNPQTATQAASVRWSAYPAQPIDAVCPASQRRTNSRLVVVVRQPTCLYHQFSASRDVR